MKKWLSLIIVIILLICSVAPVLASMADRDVIVPTEPVEIPESCLLVDGKPVAIREKEISLSTAGQHLLTQNGNEIIDTSIALSGGEWELGSDMNIKGQLTILGESFVSNGWAIKGWGLYIGEYENDTPIKADFTNSPIDVFAFGVRGNGVDLITDGSQIKTTLLYDDINKSGHIYNAVEIVPSGKIAGFVEGASEIKDLKISTDTVYLDEAVMVTDRLQNTSKTAISIRNPGLVKLIPAPIEKIKE